MSGCDPVMVDHFGDFGSSLSKRAASSDTNRECCRRSSSTTRGIHTFVTDLDRTVSNNQWLHAVLAQHSHATQSTVVN